MAADLDESDGPPAWTWVVLLVGIFLLIASLATALSAGGAAGSRAVLVNAVTLAATGALLVAWAVVARGRRDPYRTSDEECYFSLFGGTWGQYSTLTYAIAAFFGALAIVALLYRLWLIGGLVAAAAICALVLGKVAGARPSGS